MDKQLQSFRRHLGWAVAIPLLLTALIGGTFLALTYYLRNTFRSVEQRYEVQTRSQSALKLVLDMETGLRGYLLTGEDRFLEHYDRARPAAAPALEDLLRDVRRDPEEYRAVIRIQTYYAEWLNYSQRMIALRRASGPVTDPTVNLEGKLYIDLIRRDIDEVLHEEQEKLNGVLGRVTRIVRLTFISLLGLSLILGVLLATFSRRELAVAASSYDAALGTAQARTEEFRQSQRWLGAVLQSMGDAVIVTENTGRIVFTNSVAKQLLGDGQQLFAGQLTRDAIHLVDELSGKSLPDPHEAVATSGEPVLPTTRIRLVRNDGAEIPVSQVATPLRDDSGQTTGVVILLRDLSQQRLSERALQSSEKLAVMGRLAASVAHEIHNPLDALGNLLYLLEHQQMDESAKTYVRLGREELERITNISEQMLTFSREARQPVRIHLGEIIDNALTLFEPRVRRLGIVLVKQYTPKDGTVVALPGEMRQVFSNLVGNAIDAMNGPGRLVVRIRNFSGSSSSGAGAKVMICDSGPGIPPEVRGNLMDAFVTSKGEKGTGLGLWVCRGIVEKYGGSIRFFTSSKPGRNGTCFSVFLPKPNEIASPSSQMAHKTA
jgi:PAS domain S-box-containing protein